MNFFIISLILSLSAVNCRYTHHDVDAVFGISEFAKSYLEVCPNDSIKNQERVTCNPNYKYRTITGICNNLEHIWYGARNTPFDRIQLPHYDDGYQSPRRFSSDEGYDLPNARLISLSQSTHQTTIDLSEFVAFFGQFSGHDQLLTPEIEDINCDDCGTENPGCFNIFVNNIDRPDLSNCFPFKRSREQQTVFNCPSKFRNQFNANTHFLDLSTVYGSSEEENEKVRLFENGLLKFSDGPGSSKELLPIKDKAACPVRRSGCFVSGDPRVEASTLLTVLHTVFSRYHNMLAEQYKKIFPNADDEEIYQEVRRINIAVYQNIYYGEYASLVLGENILNKFNLAPLKSGYLHGYDSNILPQNSIEYQAAASRLHSLVHEFVDLANDELVQIEKIHYTNENPNTRRTFLDFDSLAFGLLTGFSNTPKPNEFSDSMNNFLFGNLSIVALNIQRGRDEGIPSYNSYRALFGLKYAKSFDDFSDNISKEEIYKMQEVYSNVNDVDLFYGINAENHLNGAIVGHTNAHIIAKNLHNLKFGDRFYFENGENKKTRFTLAQLDNIKHVRMSSVLCDTLGLRFIQESAFHVINSFDDSHYSNNQYQRVNPLIDCQQLQKINLNLFSNSKY